MSLQDRLDDLITSIGTDWKTNMVNLFGSISGGLGDLDTTDKSSFVAAINEVKAAVGAGSPTTLDDLTDVTLTSAANDDIFQRKGGVWVNRTVAQYKTDLALTKSDVGLDCYCWSIGVERRHHPAESWRLDQPHHGSA
jgi:hypothetical protein